MLPRKILLGGLVRVGVRGWGRPKQRVAMLYEHDICEMATVGLVSVSRCKTHSTSLTWWILTQDKTLWGACIDKCWPQRPLALTLPCSS